MAYDEQLDARINEATANWGTTRKRMFGGVGYLLGGNMLCGVLGNFLILRLGEHVAKEALEHPGARPFDVAGRPMKGWAMIEADMLDEAEFLHWLNKSREFAATLPPK